MSGRHGHDPAEVLLRAAVEGRQGSQGVGAGGAAGGDPVRPLQGQAQERHLRAVRSVCRLHRHASHVAVASVKRRFSPSPSPRLAIALTSSCHRAFAATASLPLAAAARLAVTTRRAASPITAANTTPPRPRYPGQTPLLEAASAAEVRAALRAGFATFALHAEARMATTCGEGFYTIGPCGEVRHATTGRSNTSRRRTVASHRPRPVPTPTTHHRRSSEPTHAPTHARHATTRLHRSFSRRSGWSCAATTPWPCTTATSPPKSHVMPACPAPCYRWTMSRWWPSGRSCSSTAPAATPFPAWTPSRAAPTVLSAAARTTLSSRRRSHHRSVDDYPLMIIR